MHRAVLAPVELVKAMFTRVDHVNGWQPSMTANVTCSTTRQQNTSPQQHAELRRTPEAEHFRLLDEVSRGPLSA